MSALPSVSTKHPNSKNWRSFFRVKATSLSVERPKNASLREKSQPQSQLATCVSRKKNSISTTLRLNMAIVNLSHSLQVPTSVLSLISKSMPWRQRIDTSCWVQAVYGMKLSGRKSVGWLNRFWQKNQSTRACKMKRLHSSLVTCFSKKLKSMLQKEKVFPLTFCRG